LNREKARQLYTHGTAWFSKEDDRKGILALGYFADPAVLSDDCFAVELDKIKEHEHKPIMGAEGHVWESGCPRRI